MNTSAVADGAHLGDRVAKLRRLSGLTQEQVADRAGISVDVVRKLEQHRKHGARLPTLHALSIGNAEQKAAGSAALGKALQLAGHLAIRLGKADLALAALERAAEAAARSGDDLLVPMVHGSVAWAYQRQNRLDDADELAVTAADNLESGSLDSAARVRVWGGLLMSAATSAARMGNYDHANDVMTAAEQRARHLAALPPPEDDGRLLSVFSPSSVRIERIRLAVQHARPGEALSLAGGIRLSSDIPPSWRTWLLLDLARAHTDLGDADQAVRTMENSAEPLPPGCASTPRQ